MKIVVRIFLLSIALALASFARPLPAAAQLQDHVEIVFLDVGQGDATLVRSPEGTTALIDAGPDSGIVPILQSHGIEVVDFLIATHPHADHIGGIESVINSIPVRYFTDNGKQHTTATYTRLLHALSESDITYLEPGNRNVSLGSVNLRLIEPLEAEEHNNSSVGVVVEFGGFRGLFTGDSEAEELNYFLDRGVPDVTVLKAPHHGSRDGLTPRWLSATNPEVVVISCGNDNPYGHPHPWALRYYKTVADHVYRTDMQGEITIHGSRDGTYSVTMESGFDAGTGQPRSRADSTTMTVGESSSISITVFPDAPGNDHHNLNGEYARLFNRSEGPIEISGWQLCDAAEHCHRFSHGTTINPGEHIVLYSGTGKDSSNEFHMGSSRAVWNNDGDVATLYDNSGRMIATYVY